MMTPAQRFSVQTKFGSGKDVPPDEQGDCTECAIATYLGIPRKSVPQLHQGDDAHKFWGRIEKFFVSRGYLCQRFGTNHLECLHLAAGVTRRGTNHMVVMKGTKLWHDPHPSGTGLEKVEHVFIAIPIDPAALPQITSEPEQRVVEWQPIETYKGEWPIRIRAPELVDEFNEAGETDACAECGVFWSAAQWDNSHDYFKTIVVTPTHWLDTSAPHIAASDTEEDRSDKESLTVAPIWLWFADNGNIRKWDRKPFDEGTHYVPEAAAHLWVADWEVLRHERDHARAQTKSYVKLLTDIYSLIYPSPFTTPDGRTMVFRPKGLDPHAILQELSDRIRALMQAGGEG